MRSLLPVSVVATLMLTAPPLLSQTCAGIASFGAGNVRLGGIAAFAEGGNAYMGEVAAGATQGLYGRAVIMTVEYDDVNDRGTGYGVGVGYGIPLNPRRTVELCPDAAIEWQFSPEFDTGFGLAEIRGTSIGFGATLGAIASSTPTFDFVPFGRAHYVSSKATLEFGGATESSTETFVALALGAGLVFNKTLTLQPSVNIPVGLEDSDPVFAIALSFNLGGRGSAGTAPAR